MPSNTTLAPTRAASAAPNDQIESKARSWTGAARDAATFTLRNAGPAMVVAAVGAVAENQLHLIDRVQDSFDPHAHDRHFFRDDAPRSVQFHALDVPGAHVGCANVGHPGHGRILNARAAVALGDNLNLVPNGPFAVGPLRPGDLAPPQAPWPAVAPPQGPGPGFFQQLNQEMIVVGWGGVGGAVGQALIPIPIVGGMLGDVLSAGVGLLWNEIF